MGFRLNRFAPLAQSHVIGAALYNPNDYTKNVSKGKKRTMSRWTISQIKLQR